MSTDFELLDERSLPIELTVTERSCTFDIDMFVAGKAGSIECATGLTPEELIDMGIKLIQIACYTGQQKAYVYAADKLKEMAY